jgi:hypothetical protein
MDIGIQKMKNVVTECLTNKKHPLDKGSWFAKMEV